MRRKRHLLILAAFVLLILLGFYFGLLRTTEAGGSVTRTASFALRRGLAPATMVPPSRPEEH
jgi:hypothetical protein